MARDFLILVLREIPYLTRSLKDARLEKPGRASPRSLDG